MDYHRDMYLVPATAMIPAPNKKMARPVSTMEDTWNVMSHTPANIINIPIAKEDLEDTNIGLACEIVFLISLMIDISTGSRTRILNP